MSLNKDLLSWPHDLVMVDSICQIEHLAYTVLLLLEVDKICGQPCTPPLPLSTSPQRCFLYVPWPLLVFGLLNDLIEPGSIRPHPDGLGNEWSMLMNMLQSVSWYYIYMSKPLLNRMHWGRADYMIWINDRARALLLWFNPEGTDLFNGNFQSLQAHVAPFA